MTLQLIVDPSARQRASTGPNGCAASGGRREVHRITPRGGLWPSTPGMCPQIERRRMRVQRVPGHAFPREGAAMTASPPVSLMAWCRSVVVDGKTTARSPGIPWSASSGGVTSSLSHPPPNGRTTLHLPMPCPPVRFPATSESPTARTKYHIHVEINGADRAKDAPRGWREILRPAAVAAIAVLSLVTDSDGAYDFDWAPGKPKSRFLITDSEAPVPARAILRHSGFGVRSAAAQPPPKGASPSLLDRCALLSNQPQF